jgi:formylglycine-generating enzyme required for sulfatase activity
MGSPIPSRGAINSRNSGGVNDLHGNAWECCPDRYGNYPRIIEDLERGSKHLVGML